MIQPLSLWYTVFNLNTVYIDINDKSVQGSIKDIYNVSTLLRA